MPSIIDGAVKWSNKRTYFFKNGNYYRFNNRRFGIDNGDSDPFPRPVGPWWFGCAKEDLENQDEIVPFSLNENRGGILLILKGLKRKDAAISLNFDTVGDELLDVIPPDE